MLKNPRIPENINNLQKTEIIGYRVVTQAYYCVLKSYPSSKTKISPPTKT